MESSGRVPQNVGCRNSDDPFTLVSLEGIDQKRIINIDGNCFDLKPLYNWVYNLEKFTNPLTNLRFSEETLSRIKRTAIKNYPCQVFMVEGSTIINQFQTSAFASWERIFINAIRTSAEEVSTLYEASKKSYEKNMQIMVRAYGRDPRDGLRGIDKLRSIFKYIKDELRSEDDGNSIKDERISLSYADIRDQEYLDDMKEVLALKGLPSQFVRPLIFEKEILVQIRSIMKLVYNKDSVHALKIFQPVLIRKTTIAEVMKLALIKYFAISKEIFRKKVLNDLYVNYKISINPSSSPRNYEGLPQYKTITTDMLSGQANNLLDIIVSHHQSPQPKYPMVINELLTREEAGVPGPVNIFPPPSPINDNPIKVYADVNIRNRDLTWEDTVLSSTIKDYVANKIRSEENGLGVPIEELINWRVEIGILGSNSIVEIYQTLKNVSIRRILSTASGEQKIWDSVNLRLYFYGPETPPPPGSLPVREILERRNFII